MWYKQECLCYIYSSCAVVNFKKQMSSESLIEDSRLDGSLMFSVLYDHQQMEVLLVFWYFHLTTCIK